jgi:hypothetical protein
LVCNRPAVSMNRKFAPRDCAATTASCASDDRHVQTCSPDFDLLHGRSAKSVAGRNHGALSALLDEVRELRAGCGFACAVHADDRNDCDAVTLLIQFRVVGRESLFHFARRDFQEIQTSLALRFKSFPGCGKNLLRHRHTEIGRQKRGFQFLDGFRREPRRARDDAFDFRREFVVRLRQTIFDFFEETEHGE